ncbi:MAG: PAS domain-containing protein [Alphaproteobacteria bacterium]|nr:PAS domain-containing protein [Alphaproteobacteria bacterium]MBT4085620.1 PAS domain-containing protein [Alphaproteobacteria bacterium]MBT4544467.1 PAS domain-containing protein [Alphaproteobacteria bacterium]MBT6385828.1 PAS domain-containing protein [Alphaproteobacteria bacterium]MBT7746242.1 PAS domain-containing protein [Alphaproteobacteria bacterium]
MKKFLAAILTTSVLVAGQPALAANGASTGAAATTVLFVFGAVVLSLGALGIAAIMWLRGRSWRLRIADERATIDDLMGAAEDLLATAHDGYLIWPRGGDRAAASERLGRMFRLDPVNIAGIDVLEPAFDAAQFVQFRRAVAGLRSDGIAFELELKSAHEGPSIRTRGSLAASGAAVVWFRELAELEALAASSSERVAAVLQDVDLMRTLLDQAPFPVWRRGKGLEVTWANKNYCSAVEADFVRVVEQGLELVPGVSVGSARAQAARAAETGASQTERRRFVVGGARRTYELIEIPLANGDIAGYAHDVTERDDAAGELARYIDAQNDVFDQLLSGIAIFGPDKQLVFSNAAYARIWELDEEWLATTPSHGDILERLRESRQLPEQANFPAYKTSVMALYTSVIDRQEEQVYLPDGRTLREIISPHPLGGLLYIFEDVSDRLELERARNTVVAVQQATLDHLFEGVAVFGPDGRLKIFNAGYARVWELDANMLAREPHVSEIAELTRPLFQTDVADEEGWLQLKEAVIRGALGRETSEHIIRRPDGVILRHAAVPLPDGAMLHSYLDITDTAQLRIELEGKVTS